MWCNNSYLENNTIQKKEICNYVSPCDVDSYNCYFNNKDKFKLQCKIASVLFYLLLVVGYYVSMIVIYGTLNRLLVSENISVNTKKSINTLVLIVTTVPLIVLYFFDTLIFNFIFVAYIITAIFVSCCVKVKDISYRDSAYKVIN
tara:strand:- start:45 stop:479 length:435 start_codon:yes stop_codon:yes gene_type:complete